MRYDIIRYYRQRKAPHRKDSEVIKERVTLEEAQKHCSDPATKTDDWFDGYTEHPDTFCAGGGLIGGRLNDRPKQ